MTKKSDKKNKPLYDKNGRWVEEKTQVKNAVRKTFRRSPQMTEALNAVRQEIVVYKKDGTPAKKPGVRYTCNMCKGLFMKKDVQVDHIYPVVPFNRTERDMTYDEMVRGVFCNTDNLQVLCSIPKCKNNNIPSCHAKKTAREKFIRSKCQENQVITLKPELLTLLNLEYDIVLKDKEQKRLEKEGRKRKKALKALKNKK